MIKITKNQGRIFTDVKEVLKAQGKDKLKPVFHYAYLTENEHNPEKKVLCCSNSYLMICLKDETKFFEECENGLYEIVKNDKQEIILVKEDSEKYQFPKIFNILPKEEKIIKIAEIPGKKELKTGKIYHAFYSNFPNCSFAINQNYLDTILNDEDFIMYLNEDEAKSGNYMAPVFFFEGDLIKVIVPFNICR